MKSYQEELDIIFKIKSFISFLYKEYIIYPEVCKKIKSVTQERASFVGDIGANAWINLDVSGEESFVELNVKEIKTFYVQLINKVVLNIGEEAFDFSKSISDTLVSLFSIIKMKNIIKTFDLKKIIDIFDDDIQNSVLKNLEISLVKRGVFKHENPSYDKFFLKDKTDTETSWDKLKDHYESNENKSYHYTVTVIKKEDLYVENETEYLNKISIIKSNNHKKLNNIYEFIFKNNLKVIYFNLSEKSKISFINFFENDKLICLEYLFNNCIDGNLNYDFYLLNSILSRELLSATHTPEYFITSEHPVHLCQNVDNLSTEFNK